MATLRSDCLLRDHRHNDLRRYRRGQFLLADQIAEDQVVHQFVIRMSDATGALSGVVVEKRLRSTWPVFAENTHGGLLERRLCLEELPFRRLHHASDVLDGILISQIVGEVVDQSEVPLWLPAIDACVKALERLGRLPYDVGMANYRKGLALKAMGDKDAAREAFTKAKRSFEESDAKQFLKRVRKELR